jgi:REP element-mobilizing transposase RayT
MSAETVKGPDLCTSLVDPRTVPFTFGRMRGVHPHLYKDGCTYFVTFCLSDTVPAKLERRRHTEEENRDPEDLAACSEPVLDRGSMLLRDPRMAAIVEDALRHFQGTRYGLHAWVVMPNHVHAVLSPFEGRVLSEILHSWKSFTASAINRRAARTGKLWQHESFDHLVRNQECLVRFIAYTEDNPVVARLCRRPEDWPFSSARFRNR